MGRSPHGVQHRSILTAEYTFVSAGPGSVGNHHAQVHTLCIQVLPHLGVKAVARGRAAALLRVDPREGQVDVIGSPVRKLPEIGCGIPGLQGVLPGSALLPSVRATKLGVPTPQVPFRIRGSRACQRRGGVRDGSVTGARRGTASGDERQD
jgi:hypothetical protein